MSGSHRPPSHELDRHLRSTVDEARLRTVWEGVIARRRRTSRPTRFVVPALAGLALAAALVALLGPGAGDAGRDAAPGPLATASGAPIPPTITAGQSVRLGDGSRITVSRGALDLASSEVGHVGWRLPEGRARFEVTPGGPRRWTVRAGDARVVVVGTVFTVDRRADTVAVEVEHGVVEVSAPGLVDGPVRLRVGERLVLAPTGPSAGPAAPARADAPTGGRAARTGERAPPTAPAPAVPPPAARPEAPGGPGSPVTDPSQRLDAPRGPSAAPSPPPDVVGLAAALDAADEARRRGRPEDAAAALLAALRDPDDPRLVGLAELTLGRLQLRELGRPAEARRWLTRALRRTWPAATRRTLHALLLEACEAADDAACARRAAEAWVDEDPAAASRPEVSRWR